MKSLSCLFAWLNAVFFLSSRSLHILLFDAERAWAYAMQLKEETVNDPRKRDHMVRRMKKAADLASELEELSKTFCDQRTAEDAHVKAKANLWLFPLLWLALDLIFFSSFFLFFFFFFFSFFAGLRSLVPWPELH